MPLVQCDNVSVAFGAQKVLDCVVAAIHDKDRIGLVGANGAGKTTLLRIVAGMAEPDAGRVSRSRGLRTAFLEQEPLLPEGANVHDAALAGFADLLQLEAQMRKTEHELAAAEAERRTALLRRLGELQGRFEHAGGYEHESRVAAVLMGVGFAENQFSRPVAVLSGGERSRLVLARLLLRDADLLLLDEPTNHLDIEGIEWFENFLLLKHRGAAIVVSHDRTFLNRTVSKIFELEEARLTEYPGSYAQYAALKQERRQAQQRAYDKQQEFIAREEDFYRRYHAAQRGREARGRMKRLQRLERIDAPRKHKTITARFTAKRDSSELCLRIEGLSKQYGEQVLFRNLNIDIYRGERIGIIGANGSGKTTLLQTVLGEMPPDRGVVHAGRNVTFGYLPQQIDDTGSQRSVLDEVWERKRTLDEVEIRNMLGRFLFSGDDDVAKPLANLSGGERKRVTLACLMLEQPNVLVLDEPTNHLDILSREALEAALEEYPGTIIVVSHDRSFLSRVIDRLIVVDGAHTRVFFGGYAEYVNRRAADARRVSAVEPRASVAPGSRKPKRKAGRPLSKNRLRQLEQEIAKTEGEKEALEKRLANPALYADAEQAQTVPQRYQKVSGRLETLYAEWAAQEGKLNT